MSLYQLRSRLRWVCLGVQVGFMLFSEIGQGGRSTNLIRKGLQNSGGIKSKTLTKLFDKIMNKGLELWNDKEISTTVTVPGIIRTAVGRDIWGKILGKTSLKKFLF